MNGEVGLGFLIPYAILPPPLIIKPYGFCGCKASGKRSELRSCVNREVRLGSLISHPILPQSLISLTVSVDVNLSATKKEGVRAQELKPTCEQ